MSRTLKAAARLDARGRPRKPGERTKGGRLAKAINPYDTGTPELLARKRALAGPEGHLTMTTNPLDILRTRKLISEPEWEAGLRLLDLRRGYPWPHARCIGIEPTIRGQTTESDREAKAAEKYHEATRDLSRRCKPAVVSAVFNLVVTQQWPADLLWRDSLPAKDKLARVREGLRVLARHFGMVRERAAA